MWRNGDRVGQHCFRALSFKLLFKKQQEFSWPLPPSMVSLIFWMVPNERNWASRSQSYQTLISSFFWFLLLSLAISKYWQYFLILQTLKLNTEKQKKIFVLRRKKFGRIDSRRKERRLRPHVLLPIISYLLNIRTSLPRSMPARHGWLLLSLLFLMRMEDTMFAYVSSSRPLSLSTLYAFWVNN